MKLGNETFKWLPLTRINQWQTEDWRNIFSYHTDWRWQEKRKLLWKGPLEQVTLDRHKIKSTEAWAQHFAEWQGHAQESPKPWISHFPNIPKSPQTPSTRTQLQDCSCFSAALEVGGLGSEWSLLLAKSDCNELLGIFLQKENHVLPCLEME